MISIKNLIGFIIENYEHENMIVQELGKHREVLIFWDRKQINLILKVTSQKIQQFLHSFPTSFNQ